MLRPFHGANTGSNAAKSFNNLVQNSNARKALSRSRRVSSETSLVRVTSWPVAHLMRTAQVWAQRIQQRERSMKTNLCRASGILAVLVLAIRSEEHTSELQAP